MTLSFRPLLSAFKNAIARAAKLRPLSTVERLPDNPLGSAQHIEEHVFLDLLERAKLNHHPLIDSFEEALGFSVDRIWLDRLALHTQIVIKRSTLNYQHGRIVYAALCARLSELDENESLQIFETGTARGFSAVCMAKALRDLGRHGHILTIDILPHRKPIFWNCIDDRSGPKTRQELLSPWVDLTKMIIFLQEETLVSIERLSMQRIHFAFLDASHTYEDVMQEFAFVSERQQSGDMIVFDDVTDAVFPGVVDAVREIETQANYRIRHIKADTQRGYAVATRL